MGGEYRYNKFPQVGNEFPRGQFYFNSRFTNTITATGPTTATQSGGYAGADFMLGYTYNAHCRRLARAGRFPQQRMGGLHRRLLEGDPAPDRQLGFTVGGRAADVGQTRPRAECPDRIRGPSQRGECAECQSASGLRAHGEGGLLRGHQFPVHILLQHPRIKDDPPEPFILCRRSGTGGWASG